MKHLPHKIATDPSYQILLLEEAIALLEIELQQASQALNNFEYKISVQLHDQILRIRDLTLLYKRQQENKKAWRLQQKKKGKNYLEPIGLKIIKPIIKDVREQHSDDQQELKRLYKDALVHVHPDKFGLEDEKLNGKATALTVQLIDIYKSSDLNELRDFHKHIINGNAISHVPYKPETIVDPAAMLDYLLKTKEGLMQRLQDIKATEFYQVLTTYPDPFTFIKEIRILFDQRIVQLEKRMKSKWQ